MAASLSAEMSHATLFELDAVAETAQIALAWGITIRQNRGDTTAREPRTYHGRGFSLSAIPTGGRHSVHASLTADRDIGGRAECSAAAHTTIVDVDQNG